MSKEQLNYIRILLERLDAAVVVKEPGNARSAEAFDGLRKSILVSSKNRRTHIAHLLSLADSIERGATTELIGERVRDFLFELGVKPLTQVTHPDMFEITEVIEGEADDYEVLQPAIVEQLETGEISLIRLGRAKQIKGPKMQEMEPTTELPNQEIPTQLLPNPVETQALWVRSVLLLLVGLLLGILGHAIFSDSNNKTEPTPTTVHRESSNNTTTTTLSTSSSISPTTTIGK